MTITNFKRSLSVMFLPVLLVTSTWTVAQVETNPSNPNYDSEKRQRYTQLRERNSSGEAGTAQNESFERQITPAVMTKATSTCFIPIDPSYTSIPRNDDGSFGPIALPFTFDLYGSSYTQVWINTNGNLTFTGPYSAYSASGFPFSIPMVAPFWGDVDTRNIQGGQIYYKLSATNLIVTWDNVGYYNQQVDKLNEFQVVISDGVDPITGLGQNVCFNYGDMQWTTGSASSGINGFGGTPATVGVNKGNNIDFYQLGRFNQNNSAYDGPGGNPDGINYLDQNCYCSQVSSAVNIAPIANNFPQDTIQMDCGETYTLDFSFIPPEVNQTVSTTVNVNGACGTTFTTTSGSLSDINFTLIGQQCNEGLNTITFTATDDGTPVESTMVTLYVNVATCCNLTGSAVAQNESCAGAADGEISFQSTGGSAPLQYSIDGGATFGSSATVSGLAPGTYVTLIQDANGCESIPATVTISGPSVLSASASSTTIPCVGGFATVTVSASGGTPPYSGTGVYSNVLAGTYTYTVTDANGCDESVTIAVIDNDNIPPTAICQDLVIDLDENGNASITASNSVLANSSSDFAGNQGVNGWTYGHYLAFDSGNFIPNQFNGFVWNNPGVGQAFDFPQLDPNGGHPAQTNLYWAVRRWTSYFSGNVTVSGDFFDRNLNCGDGANVRIFKNGVQVYEYLNVPGNSVPYSIPLSVSAGDIIDFAIDPKFDFGCDDTHFTAVISSATGIDAGSSDACGIQSLSVSQSSFDCSDVGDNTVTLTVVDNSGNSATCAATVTVNDNVAPTALCQNIAVDLDASGNAFINANDIDNGSSDACGVASITISQSSFDCSNIGVNSVTLTVTDNNGNTSMCDATVTVSDNIAPTVICQNVIIDLDASGNAFISASDIDNGSSDACGIASLTIDKSSFDCSDVGTNTVTLTVTDNNGNSSTCTANVTVNDNTAPVAVCQDLVIDLDASGNASITANDVDNGSSDGCGIASMTIDQSSFDCSDVGTNTVTLTVTDNNGNSSTCTANVTVNDNTAPVAVCQDLAIDLDASGNASITANDIDNGSSDGCGIASITIDQSSFDCSDVGTNTVTLTVTDNNGNSSTCAANVTVNDNTAPTAICQDITIDLDNTGNASVAASDVDNGSFDNCSIASSSIISGTTSFSCADVGQTFPVTLQVVDVNGNSSTCVAQVTVGGTPLVASATSTTILCFGGTTDITVSATGGFPPYSGVGNFNQLAGTYTYTVTDSKGCTDDVTITVTQPDEIEANITPQNHVIDCIPIPVTLTANPTGGTGGAYTYLWSTGETTQSIEVNPNVTTIYTVEIWDANGCTVNTSTNGTTVTVLNRCGNNNQKVIICHVPHGNTGNPQTICISPNALNPHLADLWNLHGGDYCGPCVTTNALTLGGTNEGDNTFIRAGINSEDETIELSYRIGYDSPVRLEVYDMTGKLIEVVHSSQASEGELYEFTINTNKVSSGVYIYQFITNTEKHIDKLDIVK